MWSFAIWTLVAMLHGIVAQMDASAPSCALQCWENTKYISKCFGNNVCLCNEAEYQNSVFQCLYSQCDTAHFGSALHHTIGQCAGIGSLVIPAMPPTPNHDLLRRREAEYLGGAIIRGSGSAFDLPTQSSSFLTQSANFPTQSAPGPYSLDLPSSTLPYFPLQTATAPALASATQTEQPYTALAALTTTGPILYTGISHELVPCVTLSVLATMVAMYLAF